MEITTAASLGINLLSLGALLLQEASIRLNTPIDRTWVKLRFICKELLHEDNSC